MTFLTKPPFGRRAAPHPVLIVGLTAAGTLPMHVFVPALPAAAKDFGASPGTIQLTITLYLVGVAVGQLLYGPLSDRFGRRPVVLAGFVLFVASTLFAMLALSIEQLIVARVLQSLGGCSGLVLGRAMVRDGTTAENATRQLGLLTMTMTIAPALAPAVGGFISAWIGWRAIFALLGLMGFVVLGLAALTLPETHRAIGDRRGATQLFNSYRRLLRLPVFVGYAVAGAAMTTSIYAFLSASPFLFIDLLGRPASEVGLYYVVLVGAASGGGFVASRLAGRLATRQTMRLAAWLTFGSAAMILLGDVSGHLGVVTLVAPMTLFMFATGIASPNAIAGATGADPALIGAASGLYGFIQMSYGALCTVVVGQFHADSALPVALTLLGSTMLAHAALTYGSRATRQ